VIGQHDGGIRRERAWAVSDVGKAISLAERERVWLPNVHVLITVVIAAARQTCSYSDKQSIYEDGSELGSRDRGVAPTNQAITIEVAPSKSISQVPYVPYSSQVDGFLMVAPLKLSLGGKAALPKPSSKPAQPANAFAALGDDEDKVPSTSKRPPAPFAQNAAVLSRAQKLKLAEAQTLDASVYEYDEVYDSMKEGERKALEARQEQDAERKVRSLSLTADRGLVS
jgi:hypothetical protein